MAAVSTRGGSPDEDKPDDNIHLEELESKLDELIAGIEKEALEEELEIENLGDFNGEKANEAIQLLNMSAMRFNNIIQNNVSMLSFGNIKNKVKKYLQNLKGKVQTIAKNAGADSYTITASITGVSIGVTFDI